MILVAQVTCSLIWRTTADPWTGTQSSKRVHYLLHRRFIDPLPWQRLVKRNYKRGAWFTLLTMDVRDMYKPFDEVYPAGLPAADFACQGG
jgi:hypothetical protein